MDAVPSSSTRVPASCALRRRPRSGREASAVGAVGPLREAVASRTAPVAAISSVLLCDYAQVREGLLFVLSGGITRVYRRTLPAPLGVKAAVVVEIGFAEIARPHQLVVSVKHVGTAQEMGRMTSGFKAAGALEPGESLYVPIVVDLASVAVKEYGAHDVQVAVDGAVPAQLTIYVSAQRTRRRR